ncbi:hypothetical protein H4582DRAFT_1189833 [Lactarius indigo]|nr:hypothetical protein H4582DRAFT_1861699 [Lactarius indigo]KAI9443392.1 hypothetical protein H4582DRAFT_1189833 [Lactarius indigo]
MAAPKDLSTLNVSAVYVMNKELSDDTDGIMSMQGVSWINRTAISYGTITLYVKHYKDENGVEHVDSDQTLVGIPGTTELRVLDWTKKDHYDYLFGHVVGKSRRRNVGDIEDDFLKGGWLPDTVEHGVIASSIESDTNKSGYSWTSDEVWGFEEVKGERRYTRRIKFTEKPGGKVVQARVVYDYYSPYGAQQSSDTATE